MSDNTKKFNIGDICNYRQRIEDRSRDGYSTLIHKVQVISFGENYSHYGFGQFYNINFLYSRRIDSCLEDALTLDIEETRNYKINSLLNVK